MSEGVSEEATTECERCGRADGRRLCARCGNYFCWDCGGEDLDAHCRECMPHVGTLPWDRGASPMSFLRTVWAVLAQPTTALHLRRSSDDAALPFGFAAITLSVASVVAAAWLLVVVFWERHDASVRFGGRLILTTLSLSAGGWLATIPLNFVVRTALSAAILVAVSRLGASTLAWRPALRCALYGSAFALLSAVPLLGYVALLLAPRFMVHVAVGDQQSTGRMVGLGIAILVSWWGIGALDQVIFDALTDRELDYVFFDWLTGSRR